MIQKKIHYCWFGGKKKSKLIKRCIQSWIIHMPDFELIEWNENNVDLNHPFLESCYKQKKWAFVADYIRLKVLYKYGGIYLDTDILVLKPFKELIKNKCFLGAEDDFFINCAVVGTIKKNNFIKCCLSVYDNIKISNTHNLGEISIPKIVTNVFREKFNFQNSFNKIIEIEDIIIYPKNYFYAMPYKERKNYMNFENYLDSESYAVHFWNESWVEYSVFHYFRSRQYFKGINQFYQDLISRKRINNVYLKKCLSSIKESF